MKKLKTLGLLTASVFASVLFSLAAQASGGINTITADDFNSRIENNTYVVEGQGIKITIDNNGVVTVTKDSNTVKIDGVIELNGTVLRNIDHGTTLVDNPNAAPSTSTTTTSTTATTTGTTVTNTGTTTSGSTLTKYIQRLGIH